MRIPVPVRKRLFLEVLERTGNVSEACRAVYWGRSTAYGWRDQDPEFREAWDKAIEAAVEMLVEETVRRYEKRPWASNLSTPFLERLLKLHRPELYSKFARQH